MKEPIDSDISKSAINGWSTQRKGQSKASWSIEHVDGQLELVAPADRSEWDDFHFRGGDQSVIRYR